MTWTLGPGHGDERWGMPVNCLGMAVNCWSMVLNYQYEIVETDLNAQELDFRTELV